MTGIFAPTGGPGDGMFLAGYVVTATNRSGADTAIGEVVMFDMAQTATEVDNGTPGSSDTDGNNSAYNNYINPAVTQPFIVHYVHGIVLEAIADDAAGLVLIRGRVNAAVASATVAGTALVANADGELDVAIGVNGATTVVGPGGKILAIAEEADVSNLADVLFDGYNGFGTDYGNTTAP